MLKLFQRETFDYKEIFARHIAELRSLRSREQLLQTALRSLTEVFSVTHAAILLRNQDVGDYEVRAQLGAAPATYGLAADSLLVQRLQERDQLLSWEELHNLALDTFNTDAVLLRDFVALKAIVMIPLRVEGALFGILAIGTPQGRRRFHDSELELLELFAYEVAISIQNAWLYEELLRQHGQLQELEALKNTFMANITHELATPLHSMIGLAQAVAEGVDGTVNEEQRQHLDMICRSGEKLLKIHESILTLSRLGAGADPAAIRRVRIADVLAELRPWLDSALAQRHLRLDWQVPEDLPAVYGNPEQLQQVFMQLLDNAIRFTKHGHIRLEAQTSGTMVRFCVEDSGCGIAAEAKAQVFSAFQQLQPGLNREHEGIGLGLALAKRIVELHGGRLWLESVLGQGSRFFFTLKTRPG